MTKANIIAALYTWIKQRPGLEYANYGDLTSYRTEHSHIARNKRDAEILLARVAIADTITADDLVMASKSAFCGRLSFNDDASIDYCTGQYWPTEYRTAVCVVLASALWENERTNGPGHIAGHSYGAQLSAKFRKEFGVGIAKRWFN